MRIECPSCGAEYNVPDRLLAGPARTLRCSRCQAEFPLPRIEAAPPPPPPPPPEPAPEPPPPAAPEPTSAAAEPEPTPRDDRRLKLAWAASVLAVVTALAVFVLARDSVMAAWPASTRLFATLGLV